MPQGWAAAALDPIEQSKLRSMQMRDDRNVRERAQRRLVDRGQVIEVQDVHSLRASAPQSHDPGLDDALVGALIHPGDQPFPR